MTIGLPLLKIKELLMIVVKMKIGHLQRIFCKELPLVVVNCNSLSLHTKKSLTISVHCDIGQPLILTV